MLLCRVAQNLIGCEVGIQGSNQPLFGAPKVH